MTYLVLGWQLSFAAHLPPFALAHAGKQKKKERKAGGHQYGGPPLPFSTDLWEFKVTANRLRQTWHPPRNLHSPLTKVQPACLRVSLRLHKLRLAQFKACAIEDLRDAHFAVFFKKPELRLLDPGDTAWVLISTTLVLLMVVSSMRKHAHARVCACEWWSGALSFSAVYIHARARARTRTPRWRLILAPAARVGLL